MAFRAYVSLAQLTSAKSRKSDDWLVAFPYGKINKTILIFLSPVVRETETVLLQAPKLKQI